MSVLIALIVLVLSDYAGGTDRLEGSNDASKASCAKCILVLTSLITLTAVATLVVVTTQCVLIVLKYPHLHGSDDHATCFNCTERAKAHTKPDVSYCIDAAEHFDYAAGAVYADCVGGGDCAK